METKTTPKFNSGVERDPRLFFWFLTLVMGIMYAVSLINNPGLWKPLELAIFTILMIVHVLLHWRLEKILEKSKAVIWYILLQGALAFSIAWMADLEAVVFALYTAMVGEAVGMFGLSRRALLASIFYLGLAFINVRHTMGMPSAGWTIVGIVPILLFTVVYVSLYMRQIEAREKAQSLAAELDAANRQLTEYAAQLEDLTIANERQRMARELHDTLSQGLAGIILQLEAVEAHLASSRPEKAKTIVANAMLQARATLADARKAIDDLRQPAPDDLASILRSEASRFSEATGIPCELHLSSVPSLPDPVKDTIVRAVTEGLNNIARYAQAQKAEVNITVEDQSLLLKIQDDGIGFIPEAVSSGHYGLLGIRERVRLVNGEFELHSEAGAGTAIKIKVPL
jgi:NarL family two-component system sensor histidine kinase YdfH